MSYQSTVLAKNPVAYYRCDELSGIVLTDLSVNAHNGVIDANAIFGQPSPIQTDPASSAIKDKVGTATVIPATQLTGNFTWEAWGYYDSSYFLSNTGTLINRRGQFGLSHGCQLGFNNAKVQADVTIDNGGLGDYHFLNYSPLVDQTWYYIVATRNGAVFSLYVNAVLVDQDVTLTTNPVDYVGTTSWGFGRATGTSAWWSAGTDEIALYDYPLNAAEILENYEAAILATFLHGTSAVIPTAILYSDFEPEPVNFPFRHNWADPLIERISFRTHK